MIVPPQAVILDAYGTILDTGDASLRATSAILARHRIDLAPERFYAGWKRHLRVMRTADGAFRTEADLFAESLGLTCDEFGVGRRPMTDVGLMLATWGTRTAYPEAAAVVRTLRARWKVYVASNSDAAPLARDLACNGIETDGVFSSEALRCYKPNPHFYRAVLDATGFAPVEAVWAGDSDENDVHGPERLGIAGIWINRSEQSPAQGMATPARSVADLAELADAIGPAMDAARS